MTDWPRALVYNPRWNTSRCARYFLHRRPVQVAYYEGAFYELVHDEWRWLNDEQLRWEIRSTDPADKRLTVEDVESMMRGVTHLVFRSELHPESRLLGDERVMTSDEAKLAMKAIFSRAFKEW